jgi:competence protein ComGC
MKYLMAVVILLVSILLYITIDNSTKLQKQIQKNEQRTRDSLSQIYAKFVTKSDSLQAHIDTMQTTLDKQIKQFRYDLHRIKIIEIPNTNYDNISDTLLIGRILSGYKGR